MLNPVHAGTADVVNLALVLGFDAAIIYFMGFKSLMYLVVGVVLGGGLHPMAGHLIAEHYMFLKVGPPSLNALAAVAAICNELPSPKGVSLSSSCSLRKVLIKPGKVQPAWGG